MCAHLHWHVVLICVIPQGVSSMFTHFQGVFSMFTHSPDTCYPLGCSHYVYTLFRWPGISSWTCFHQYLFVFHSCLYPLCIVYAYVYIDVYLHIFMNTDPFIHITSFINAHYFWWKSALKVKFMFPHRLCFHSFTHNPCTWRIHFCMWSLLEELSHAEQKKSETTQCKTGNTPTAE